MHNRLIRRAPQQPHLLLSSELAVSLPVLGIVLMGLLEFSLMVQARTVVVAASRRGAEVAAIPGATENDVRHEVRDVLGARLGYEAEIHLQGVSEGEAYVAVDVPMAAAIPNLMRPVGLDLQGHRLCCQTPLVVH